MSDFILECKLRKTQISSYANNAKLLFFLQTTVATLLVVVEVASGGLVPLMRETGPDFLATAINKLYSCYVSPPVVFIS